MHRADRTGLRVGAGKLNWIKGWRREAVGFIKRKEGTTIQGYS